MTVDAREMKPEMQLIHQLIKAPKHLPDINYMFELEMHAACTFRMQYFTAHKLQKRDGPKGILQ